MAVKGKDVLIYEGPIGTMPIIAGAKSCTVSTSCDLIEKASLCWHEETPIPFASSSAMPH